MPTAIYKRLWSECVSTNNSFYISECAQQVHPPDVSIALRSAGERGGGVRSQAALPSRRQATNSPSIEAVHHHAAWGMRRVVESYL